MDVTPTISAKPTLENVQCMDPWWRSTDLAISHMNLLLARAATPPPPMATDNHVQGRRKIRRGEGVGPRRRLHRLHTGTSRVGMHGREGGNDAVGWGPARLALGWDDAGAERAF